MSLANFCVKRLSCTMASAVIVSKPMPTLPTPLMSHYQKQNSIIPKLKPVAMTNTDFTKAASLDFDRLNPDPGLPPLRQHHQLDQLEHLNASSILTTRPLSEDDVIVGGRNIVFCSSINQNNHLDLSAAGGDGEGSASESGKNKNNDGKCSEQDLKDMEAKLVNLTQRLFAGKNEPTLFDKNIVFENKITGATYNGLPAYISYLSMIKVVGHIRYAFVTSVVLNSHVDVNSSTITIRFRFLSMGAIKMAAMYIPKKLYKFENRLRECNVWVDAISTYTLDSDGKVIRHVVDNKDLDRGNLAKSTVEQVKERLEKLKRVPSPAAV